MLKWAAELGLLWALLDIVPSTALFTGNSRGESTSIYYVF